MIMGTWTLVKYTMCLDGTQEILHPYGENPIGFLIYTSDDVSVHIMKPNRHLKDNPLAEKIERAENYGGYVGSYEIRDNDIIHYPRVSSFVSFLQAPQIRNFKLQDNALLLEYSFFCKDREKKAKSQLIWRRVIR
jgi:hypothetical protein